MTDPAAPPTPRRTGARPHDREDIGWGRAFVSGLAIVVLGVLVCVYLPNWLVVHLTGLGRATREDLAAIVAVLAVAAMAWLLRRLQRSGLI